MTYIPSALILERYAQVLVNFALHHGKGVQPGEVVWVRIAESAKPLYAPLRNTILKAGAIPLIHYTPDEVGRADEYSLASEAQLGFFLRDYYKGIIKQVDHAIMILGEANPYELREVDPKKIFITAKARRPFMKWREQKELQGKFSWTLALYGTPAMANEVGMSEEEYWDQIIAACFLDLSDPIAQWQQVESELQRLTTKLNSLPIEYLTVTGNEVNLKVGLGAERKWLAGSGANIPSFEVFTSPNWRETEGEIHFNQPLYFQGNVVRDIYLRFRRGKVVEMRAAEGQSFLQELLSTPGGNQLGEFSLTDTRLSRITKIMGETLYDENIGGPEGNMHIAIGSAYREAYKGDSSRTPEKEWRRLGYNSSPVHNDLITTSPRTVTAHLTNGQNMVLYQKGKFKI